MEYEEIDFMTPIMEFIKKFPGFDSVNKISMIPFDPSTVEGNGLAYSGTTIPLRQPYVDGNRIIDFQSNWILYFQRQLIDEIDNKDQANFIANLERWVLLKDINNETPKFSNFDNSEERFWADNGLLWEINRDVRIPYAEYQIQIHASYKLEIKKRKEDDIEWQLNMKK